LADSFLLLEELFATGDDRFAQSIREFHVPGSLATLADRWRKDPRPWARQQVLQYLDEPLNAAGHQTVVKRLFKQAEENRDDELMAAFAAAFDRLVRRQRRTRWQWDHVAREATQIEVLASPRDVQPTPTVSAKGKPVKPSFSEARSGKGQFLFSYHTRYYLRRRVWRYFRSLGYQKPDAYPAAVARMLARYRDTELARGENILDSWGLVHACFGESDVLEIGASRVQLREGRALGELTPSPQFPELWKRPDSAPVLIDLLLKCSVRLIRVWTIGMLRRDHAEALAAMSVSDIRRLLDHPDDEVQLLGAQVLEQSKELDKLTVSAWMELLSVRNPTVLETICRLMASHVRAGRLDLRQCVELACAKAVPVSRLGFDFLQNRDVRTEQDREIIAQLAAARCAKTGEAIARWALERLGTADVYRVDRVAAFFDSLLAEVREGAWAWLTPSASGWNDPELWSRLLESPYDDVRMHFVSALQQRLAAPGLDASRLSALWVSVLLGIHRGGRHKLIALRQISDAVRGNPQSAETLLPVLALAIRSVRVPEARAGLAAVVAAVDARPELADVIARHLPELQLSPEGASR
jgi:hypothetical protein